MGHPQTGWGSVQGTLVDRVRSGTHLATSGTGGGPGRAAVGQDPGGLQPPGMECRCPYPLRWGRSGGHTNLLLQAPVMSRYLSARQVSGHWGGSM